MKIVTDTAANLPAEEAQSLGVAVAPLFIQFPEGEVNSNQISADEFYNRLKAMEPAIPTTAQPSEKVFTEIYEKETVKGDEILSLHISSGLSGTINAARLAAREMSDRVIHLVDTMTLSGGERFQVLAAAYAARKGWNVQAILKRLEEIRGCTETVYTLETLKYLARGGRIGRVQALAGSLLNIKPIIHVEHTDGKYTSVGRARTVRRAMEEIVDYLGNFYKGEKGIWATVLHGNLPGPAEEMSQLLKSKLSIAKSEIVRVTPVLGVHTGPGVVGVATVPMRLMDDLLS